VLRLACARCVGIDFGREETERKQKKKTQAAVVQKLLKNVEKKLGGEDVKATLGDYIRLVQLQQELEDEEPRDITVTWVEPKSEA
jgi:SAM-dependent MidA family methyltransferase